MSTLDFFVENYPTLFELIGIIFILALSAHISRRMKALALLSVILLMIEIVMFYLEAWTQTFDRLSLFRPLLTAGLYTIYPLILIVITNINVPRTPPKPVRLLLLMPWLISVPLYFTSQQTHLVSWYLENNRYQGGPLYWLPYTVFTFYGIVFLIRTFIYFKNYSRLNQFFTAYIVIAPILGATLYTIVQNNYDYNELFSTALLLYLFCTYIHMAKTDSLTSLLNRQSYYKDMRSKSRFITAVASIDMNDLKPINDNYGHEAGDTALKTVAEVLRDNCGDRGTAYRIGGDEFIIFYTDTDLKTLEGNVAKMRSKMSETSYSCAFGYTVKAPDEPIKDAIIRADHMMYDNKAQMKNTAVRDVSCQV